MHTIITEYGHRSHQIGELDMLKHRLIDFVLVRASLFFRTAIQYIGFFGPETNSGTTAVHSRDARTQDSHLLANKGRLTVVRLLQPANTILDALKVSTGDDFII